MSTREARLRAQKRYDDSHRENYKHFDLKCNREADKDIIDYLLKMDNKSGYIKNLIRIDMAGGK